MPEGGSDHDATHTTPPAGEGGAFEAAGRTFTRDHSVRPTGGTAPYAGGEGANVDLPPAASPPPGYEVLGVLGRGGMGVVYRARQVALNREVALKVLLAGDHASLSQRARFLAEAEAAARVVHSGVVQVYDYGTWGGQPFLALEYCPGGSLSERLAGTPLPPPAAVELVEGVAKAVAHLHAGGVVHRDLKPANVLLAADGTPKVGDFGLAKLLESGDRLTATGAVLGTPAYMAPEQARGDARGVGTAADVWALGAVLYECLTGRPPFQGSSPAATVLLVLEQEPVPVRALNPAVPADLETVCLKCLDKDPARRYPAAGPLAADLGRWLAGRPVLARPVGPLGRGWRWARRHPAVAGLLAAVLGVFAAGAGASYAGYRRAEEHRTVAEGEAAAKAELVRELTTERTHLRQSVERLAAQREATEVAFLRGVLRPLSADRLVEREGAKVSPEQFAALRDLATADEPARLRALEACGTSPGGPAVAVTWRRELVWAVVGLDRAAGVRLRERVSALLTADATPPDLRTAAAMWATVLPPGDGRMEDVAAGVLSARMESANGFAELDQLAEGLSLLARRGVSAAAAARAARALVRRLGGERDPALLSRLAVPFDPLVDRLAPADVAPLAAALAPTVAHRAAGDGLSEWWHLASATAALARRLPPAEGASLVRPLAEQLAAYVRSPAPPESLGLPAATLAAWSRFLPARVAAGIARPAAQAVAARLAADKEGDELKPLADALGPLAGWLTPAELAAAARPGAKWAADGLATETEPDRLRVRAETLAVLTRMLPAGEAEGLAGPPARALADRVVRAARPSAATASAKPLLELLDWLPVDRAEAAALAAAALVTPSLSPGEVEDLAVVVSALAGRLPTEAAARVVRRPAGVVAGRLASAESFRVGNEYLASALVVLTGRLTADERGELVRPAAAAVVRLMVGPHPDASGLGHRVLWLQDAVRALGAWFEPSAARDLGVKVAVGMSDDPSSVAHTYLTRALGLLGRHLTEDDLLAVLKTLAVSDSLRADVLGELGRRARRPVTAPHAALGGVGVLGAAEPFADVWEFATWAEVHRPHWDLATRPTRPWGTE